MYLYNNISPISQEI